MGAVLLGVLPPARAKPRVWGSLSACGNRDEAEDLVQTTLVKVVLGARRHGRLESLEAYARKTLVNTFISARRRFWRREHAYGEVPDVAGRPVDSDTGWWTRSRYPGAAAARPSSRRPRG